MPRRDGGMTLTPSASRLTISAQKLRVRDIHALPQISLHVVLNNLRFA
jgi:hypothetical protein